jgi:ADP-ribose pyrophosphatase YjhB (NUDIX family)
MKITEPFKAEPNYLFEYQDADSFDDLEYEKCKQTYGVCFYNGKLIVAFGYFGGVGKSWGLIGGRIEKGETFEQTLRREVQEESNMKIISFKPIGYQKVINTKDQSFVYQLRYACIVEPIGEFESDPAGTISEIKLIDPKEYKKYFDWGQIGERIITRGTEIVQSMKMDI